MSNLVLNMSKTIIYDFPDLTPEGGGGGEGITIRFTIYLVDHWDLGVAIGLYLNFRSRF